MSMCAGMCGRTLIPKRDTPTLSSEARTAARGMCSGCYIRHWRHGNLDIRETPKVCATCGRLMRTRTSETYAHATHEAQGECAACVRRQARPTTPHAHIGRRGRAKTPDPMNVYREGNNGPHYVNAAGVAQMLQCSPSHVTTLTTGGQLRGFRSEEEVFCTPKMLYLISEVKELAKRGPIVCRDPILLPA